VRVGIISEQVRQTVPGGIGTYLLGLLDGLAELNEPGIDVVTLATRPKGFDPLSGRSIPIATFPFPHRLQMALWDRGLGAPRVPLDVIHLSSLAGPVTKKNVPARTVMVHDLSWRHFPELTTSRGARWHEAALQRVIDSEALILTTSINVAEEVSAAGVDRGRITVVHAGSDHLKIEDVPGAQALLETLGVSGQFFLTVSTIEPRKNLPALIKAYEQARVEFDETVPLVIVGPEGWGPSIKRSQGVILAGRQNDEILAALYSMATCFVYVPLHEGFGLPPIEAMAHSSPVIVSTQTPSTELTTGCWKVDARDTDAVAQQMLRALSDDVERSAIAIQGKAFADNYRWIDVAKAHCDVWKRTQ